MLFGFLIINNNCIFLIKRVFFLVCFFFILLLLLLWFVVILNKLSALPAQVNDKLHACFCSSLMPTKKGVIGVSSPRYYIGMYMYGTLFYILLLLAQYYSIWFCSCLLLVACHWLLNKNCAVCLDAYSALWTTVWGSSWYSLHFLRSLRNNMYVCMYIIRNIK